jgi:methyl-accepting chemotaxis protein
MIQEEAVTRNTAQEDELLAAQVDAHRAKFALGFTRYIVGGAAATIVLSIAAWFLGREYKQLYMFAGMMAIILAGAAIYPYFHRRGQAKSGILVFLVLFALLVALCPVLVPQVLAPAALCFVVPVVLSYLLLGDQTGRWFTGACAILMAADFALVKWATPYLFPILPANVELVLGLGVSPAVFAAIALIMRMVVIEQESSFLHSQRATIQSERQAAVERKQREQLQAANREIERRIGIEQAHREQLQRILARVREAAGELGSAGTEILAATTQQASGANEQSAAIAQTTTTVDEVKVIAEQSMKRSQEVAGISERTVRIARAGQQAVQETIASMAQIKERVEGIAENILALSEQTQQIGEIIATVNDIAAQSNMLALNASVEAARAGEHGKGFSVVAVEVRNLAEQSRQATAQVKAILSDIQRATNASVMATEEGTKGVDVGVQLAGETREAIGRLSAAIEESAQAALQMVAGGQQQASGIEQIALAMANINQATVQSLASTRQAEQTAQNLNELAHSLNQIVELAQ